MVHGYYKRTMAKDCKTHSEAQSTTWEIGQAGTKLKRCAQRHSLDITNRSTMGRYARPVSAQKHLPPAFPEVDRIGGLRQNTHGIGAGLERAWRHRPKRRFYRWQLLAGQKRGDGVGKTKRGKGTKIMGLTDAGGIPLAIDAASASPHEITLVDATLDACFLEELPAQLIGDKAYDSDKLDNRLVEGRGIAMIAPHRENRLRAPTQDGRALRRYKRRWKIERLWAWLQNFRRIVVRYEYHLKNFLAMIQLGCIVILLRRVLG